MKAVVADPVGGPENLKFVDLPEPELKPGEALVKVEAAGVNFIDVYLRNGLYQAPAPVRLGKEGAGTVLAAASDVHLAPGTRVAWAMGNGGYAELAAVPAALLVPVPDEVSSADAAAVMLQGMTAHYLTRSTFPLQPGHTCLIHAAAGGAGLLAVQLAKLAGARVIGTVSTAEKAALVRARGADETILYTQQDFKEEVKRLTDGQGVDVVYDSVGKTTFLKSLECLKPRGAMVLFGQSSGPVDPISPQLLNEKGSVYLTRPTLTHYMQTREELEWRAGELFEWLQNGKLKLQIHKIYPLREAVEAHRDLESRRTTGKLLLQP